MNPANQANQASAEYLAELARQTGIPDEDLNAWDPSGMQAMQEVEQLVREMTWEEDCRAVFANPNTHFGGALCEAHRSGALPTPNQTITKQTALLPVCNDCCENQCGFKPDHQCPPYDTCSCASRLMIFGCWACGLGHMEQLKTLAIGIQKKRFGLPPYHREVLFCKCGKNLEGQRSRPGPEVVRQCACCHGFAIKTFTNYAGEIVVFKNLTADVKEIFPALPPPSVSVEGATGAAGELMVEAATQHANAGVAGAGMNNAMTPEQTTTTMPPPPPPPPPYPQAASHQAKPLPTLPRPTYLLPTTTLLEPGPRPATKGRKRKTAPVEESSMSLGIGDEEGSKKKRVKATPTPQRKSQKGGLDKNAELATMQNELNGLRPSKPLLPFVPPAKSNNDPPTMPNSTTAATKPTVSSHRALNTHPNTTATSPSPAQPKHLNGATDIVKLAERKALLRQKYKEHQPTFPAPTQALMDRMMKLEKDTKGGKPYTKVGYEQLLRSCGFDAHTSQRIGGFVEIVWNGKVAVNEVGVVAALALSFWTGVDTGLVI